MHNEREVVQMLDLPLNLNDHRAPLWWGMVGIIAIEATVFLALITSYYYLRLFAVAWPPEGIGLPDLGLPLASTALLLASSIPVYWADHRARKGDLRALKIGLLLGVVLAVAFLAIKVYEYSHVGFRWDTHAYGSIVFAIIGFHSAHVIALLFKTLVVLAAAFRGHFSAQRNVGVQINGLYWHFVVIAWLPLFFTLYLSPRLLGVKGG